MGWMGESIGDTTSDDSNLLVLKIPVSAIVRIIRKTLLTSQPIFSFKQNNVQ